MSVKVEVVGIPTIDVSWSQKMNAQQAMEEAYDPAVFTYALQYYGKGLGYLVLAINETYESFVSTAHPFFFWEFLVNGSPAQTGIDYTILNDGDVIRFELQQYDPVAHSTSTLQAKFAARVAGAVVASVPSGRSGQRRGPSDPRSGAPRRRTGRR